MPHYCLRERTVVRVAGQSDVCSPNPCLNSGRCSVRPADQITSSSPRRYSCMCYGGFWGVVCAQFNPCSVSGACYNGGTCHNTSSVTYTCSCQSGYYGDRCEVSLRFILTSLKGRQSNILN